MAAETAAEVGVLRARDGLVVAGKTICSAPFVRDFLSRKGQEVRDEIPRLVDLPHPLTFQDEWVILPRSLQLRLQHLSGQFHGLSTLQIFAKLPSRSSANPKPAQQGLTLRPPSFCSIFRCARGESVSATFLLQRELMPSFPQ
jgi:hypothetical protein